MRRKPEEKPGKHARILSPEEAELWRRVQRTAIPMPGRKITAIEPATDGRDMPGADAKTTGGNRVAMPRPAPEPRSAAAAPVISYLDDRTLRELRRGRLEIDAILDLHGMTQERAHAALSGFVSSNRARGSRIVLVITGKGEGGNGILRRMVPEWLRQPPLSGLVSAYRVAHASHGGKGALYVRLRKQRQL